MSAFDDGGWLVPRVVFASLAVAIAAAPVGPTQVAESVTHRDRVAPSEPSDRQRHPPVAEEEENGGLGPGVGGAAGVLGETPTAPDG